MSTFAPPSETERLAAAFRDAEQPVAQENPPPGAWEGVAAVLEASPPALHRGVDFFVRRAPGEYATSRCRVVDASHADVPVDPRAVATHVDALARFFAYAPRDTVVFLALVAKPKVLRDGARMADVNGGATFRDRRLIILWRYDADFWKVLTHELVHLMMGTVDEALTEATALRLWCAIRATRGGASFERRLERQIDITRALAAEVAALDTHETNEREYAGPRTLCFLAGECGGGAVTPAAGGRKARMFLSTDGAV